MKLPPEIETADLVLCCLQDTAMLKAKDNAMGCPLSEALQRVQETGRR